MTSASASKGIILFALTLIWWCGFNRRSYNQPAPIVQTSSSERRAIAFLSREVPDWSKENGCYSCHNNGDGARALYLAAKKGYEISASSLAETTAWLKRPFGWDENKGDPGFSDKRLADLQFAYSLMFATASWRVDDPTILMQAAQKLLRNQQPDGSWKIEGENDIGSPATYGTALATWTGVEILRSANDAAFQPSIQKAQAWIGRLTPGNTIHASILLRIQSNTPEEKQRVSLRWLEKAQTRAGGWGPYADSPAEPFDTAIAMLALIEHREQPVVVEMIRRSREFLMSRQEKNGSWPATTRPPNGESYAQMISTTAWATIALLESAAIVKSSNFKGLPHNRRFQPALNIVEQIDFKRFADVVPGQIFDQGLNCQLISPRAPWTFRSEYPTALLFP